MAIEYKVLALFSQKIKAHRQRLSIKEFIKNDITYLNPNFSASGLVVRYPDEDIQTIQSLNLDLIIRGNAPGIFKGKIHQASNEGIISFHHGDNRWNRGGPPAFWEVYLRKPATGFIIQILSEELDGGSVIYSGSVATKRSFTENIVNLYGASNPSLTRIILEYAETNQLPSPQETVPYGGGLLKSPSFFQMISYLSRTYWLFFALFIRRFVLRRRDNWGVAFFAGSWQNAILRKGVQIKNPAGRFFADPFVVTKENRTVCFVEDYYHKTKLGCISAVEILDKKQYNILGPVIQEPYHMSFPYLFEYEQELYMVPETCDSKSIRLYKCIEFPMKWEYQHDLLSNVKTVDTMIFQHQERWWLLTNLDIYGSQLMAYYSDSPLSQEWTSHQQNPLLLDSSIGRNAGILDPNSDTPVRGRQQQGFNMYGASLSLARITDLSPSSFSEEQICQINPEFFPNIKGCHHIHSNDEFTVYDYFYN